MRIRNIIIDRMYHPFLYIVPQNMISHNDLEAFCAYLVMFFLHDKVIIRGLNAP